MSKKRFSAGLDDLFSISNTSGDDLNSNAVLMSSPASPSERKSTVQKSFATDIDSLLQEALDERMERFESGQPDAVSASAKTKSTQTSRAPMRSGLDSLIRQTIDVQDISADELTGKKRLTVAVDRPKLEKLKAIARLENSYLKDILISLIDEYIQEYTRENGADL